MNELLNTQYVQADPDTYKSTIHQEPIFVINDIELPIAPLNIALQKEDLVYRYKTLRTNASTKIGSGRGVYNLQLSFIFPNEMLLMLHRLIIQVRNCPFVYIDNDYIRSSLGGINISKSNMFFTVTNFHIRNSDKSPTAFIVNMDLRFFNYEPYSGNLLFKKDLWTRRFGSRNDVETDAGSVDSRQNTTQLSFPVFDKSKPIVKSTFVLDPNDLTSRTNYNSILGSLTETIKDFETSTPVKRPTLSNVYVRYYNQLQIDSLVNNFGISLDYIITSLGDQKDYFEIGKKLENDYQVFGLHSKYLNINVRDALIQKMLRGAGDNQENNTIFKYYKYKYDELSPSSLYYISELLKRNSGNPSENIDDLIRTRKGEIASSYQDGNFFQERINLNLENLQGTVVQPLNSNVDICPIQPTNYQNVYLLVAPFDGRFWRRTAPYIFENGSGSFFQFYRNGYNDRWFYFGNLPRSNNFLKKINIIEQPGSDRIYVDKGTILGVITNNSDNNYDFSNIKYVERSSNFEIAIMNQDGSLLPRHRNNINDRIVENEEITISEIDRFIKRNAQDEYTLVIQEFVTSAFKKGTEISFAHSNNPGDSFVETEGTVTAVSASFSNLISSIPIAEYEHPTHQFLGSVEPSYTINIVSKKTADDGTDVFLNTINTLQSTLSENSRLYKEIYDSGNLRVRTFLTKLLGTFQIEDEQGKEARNCIIDSVTSETVEGLPGVSSTLIRFSETNSIQDEDVNVADARDTTSTLEAKYKAAYFSALGLGQRAFRTRRTSSLNTVTANNRPRQWRTKHFSADMWYSKAESLRGLNFNRDNLSIFLDQCGYQLCLLLDEIQGLYPDKYIKLVDTFNNRSKRVSHHEVNCAVDIRIFGVNVVQAINRILDEIIDPVNGNPKWRNFIYERHSPDTPLYRTVGIGAYGSVASGAAKDNDYTIVMDDDKKNGMIHLDLNINRPLLAKEGVDFNDPRTANSIRTRPRWLGETGDYQWVDGAPGWNNTLRLDAEGAVENEQDEGDASEAPVTGRIPEHVIAEISEVSQTLSEDDFLAFLQSKNIEVDELIGEISISRRGTNNSSNGYVITYGNSVNTELIRRINNLQIDNRKVFTNPLVRQGNRGPITLPRSIVDSRSVPTLLRATESATSIGLEREMATVVRMINHFKDFASFILAEPETYKNQNEVDAEKQRIRNELLGIDIEPSLYTNLQSIFNESARINYMHRIMPLARENRSGLVSYSQSLNWIDSLLFLKDKLKKLNINVQSLIKENKINEGIISSLDNNNNLSSDFQKVMLLIADLPFVKVFSEEANSLRAYSDIAQLLNTRIGTETSQQLSALSSNMTGNDIEEFMYGLFGYRAVEERTLEESGFFSRLINAISGDYELTRHGNVESRNYVSLNRLLAGSIFDNARQALDRNYASQYVYSYSSEYLREINQFADNTSAAENFVGDNSSIKRAKWDILVNSNNSDFFNKDIIQQRQDNKLRYLRRLLYSLLAKLISNDTFRRYSEIDVVERLFKIDLGNESAYPDLNLPKNPIGITSDRYLNPGFFFHREETNLEGNQEAYREIIGNSIKFMQNLQGGVYSGTVESLVQTGDGFLALGENANLGDIILSGDEGSRRPIVTFPSSGGPAVKADGEAPEDPTVGRLDLDISVNVNYFDLTERELQNYGSGATIQERADNLFGSSQSSRDVSEKVSENNNTDERASRATARRLATQRDDLSEDNTKEISDQLFEDIKKQKKNIVEAFPTFKLYLIEEDRNDSENYFVFDDFYSYNAVLDFTVHKSRKLAADLAVIRLQNISGSLDGTKRGVLRDTDIEKEFEETGFVSNTINTSSIILRPGINAQLRAGYSSNPNKLEILISGRIADVSYSNQTDMIEVTLQSFGYELESKRYGGMGGNNFANRNYYSTKSLLASLVLDESLSHFGRYKVGRVFQTNENIDNTFVKRERVSKRYFNWNLTSSVLDQANSTNFMYAAVTIGVLIAVTAVSRGRTSSPLSRFIGYFKSSTAANAERSAFTTLLAKGGNFLKGAYRNNRLLNTSRVIADPIGSAGRTIASVKELYRLGATTTQPNIVMRALGVYGRGWAEAGALSLSILTGAFVIDTLWEGVGSLLKAGGKLLSDWFTPNVTLLKLDPQDDNIFAPSEDVYIDQSYKSADWEELRTIAEESKLLVWDLMTWGIGASARENPQEIYNNFFKEPFKYFDKRLPSKVHAHVYNFENFIGGKTAWQIFEEMSLRHPGYVYGARQYGDGLEYRLFFGLPTQRYWSKDISPSKARRLNMIYSSLRGDDVSVFASDNFTSKFFSADQINEINRIRITMLQKRVEL